MNIFKFKKYRKYLQNYLEKSPRRGRGQRTAMAEAIGCQSAYITHILQGRADLSFEQAFALSEYLGHSENESEYFLLLVSGERAGSAPLKRYYKKKILEAQNRALNLKEQYKLADGISEQDQLRYFSFIENSLVHMLLTIPEYQTKEEVRSRLKIPQRRLSEILEFLERLGLIVLDKKGRYQVTEQSLHLPDDAATIGVFHSQHRLQAIRSCQNPGAMDIHYSSNITISREDFMRIKQELVEALSRCNKYVEESPAKMLCNLSIDLFEI